MAVAPDRPGASSGRGASAPEGPLPLIVLLARNMIAALDVPAYVTSPDGELLSVNEAASQLTGGRFEEFGRLPPEHWSHLAPRDFEGSPLARSAGPLTVALRRGTPAHGRFHVRAGDGRLIEVEATAFPLCDEADSRGAAVLFWPCREPPPT
jgi:PAS domain-containing protein